MRRSIVFLFASLAWAQNDSVFRTTTQLVRVDVAAQDKNGHPVADLTKDDFELKVNGKIHPVDTFTVTSATPVSEEPLPRGTFTNKRATAEISQGRYTVFLLDWRNTNWTLQAFANQQLLKMLEATPPGGKVAIYLLNNGFQILQEFTSDRELLLAKATDLEGAVPPPMTDLAQAENAAKETVTAFRDIAKHLAGISGQKVLVWVSTGFPDNEPPPPLPPGTPPIPITRADAVPSTSFLLDIDQAVRILGNANIVVESAESSYLGASVKPENGPVRSSINTLQMIAERTGGRYFQADTNDLAATFRDAANDRATSYEIGFYDPGNFQPGLVPIQIRTTRAGVTLRYREGFYVEKDQPAKPTEVRGIAEDVLTRAVDAVTIPLTARAMKTAGNAGTIALRLNVDAKALTLQPDGDVWHVKPSVLARFASDVEDQMGEIPLDSPSLTFTAPQRDQALRNGINLRFTMRIPAGAASMRVLVRDGDSGDSGTVTVSLHDLPEF